MLWGLLGETWDSVTVVEQLDRPGGYACSFDRANGKFTFDVSLHGTAVKDNAAARILDDLGALESQRFSIGRISALKTTILGLKTSNIDKSSPMGSWTIEYINDRLVIDNSAAYIQFSKNGKVAGKASFNTFMRGYKLSDSQVSFSKAPRSEGRSFTDSRGFPR